MDWSEVVALVTGGGSGIGQAIGKLFAREGARVAVADRVVARAEETVRHIKASGGSALAIEADVSDAAQVEAMSRHVKAAFGPVTILVNNAGLAIGDDILQIDEATWDLNLAIVLKSVFLCSKATLPGMIAQKHGVIVNVSSVNGLGGFGEEAYAAAKAGIINLTQNMAVKYGPHGIRVNCVCPGTIRTPIWQQRLDRDPKVFERLAAWYPLGRVGEPEDVAHAVRFLASDDASWITGVTLVVDGGLMAGNMRIGQELEQARGA